MQAKQPLRIGLDWVINIQHGLLIYAKAQNLIPKDTEFVPFQSSSKALQQLSLGTINLAISYEPAIKALQKKGLQIEEGLTLITEPLDVFVSAVPLKDLKGKKIGHQSSPGSFSENFLGTILKSVSLTFNDVERVYSLYHLSQGLLSGQYDAAMHIPLIYAPELLEHKPDLCIYKLKGFGISYNGQVLVQHKNSKNMEAIYKGLMQAKDALIANPENAWNVIIKEHPELDTTNAKERWRRYIALLS
jgi:ABC-type nitrate/sulfonate/bicarbonate transport system substrate-binding protein